MSDRRLCVAAAALVLFLAGGCGDGTQESTTSTVSSTVTTTPPPDPRAVGVQWAKTVQPAVDSVVAAHRRVGDGSTRDFVSNLTAMADAARAMSTTLQGTPAGAFAVEADEIRRTTDRLEVSVRGLADCFARNGACGSAYNAYEEAFSSWSAAFEALRKRTLCIEAGRTDC